MALAYYVHNLNPIIFHLGPISPRWYGVSYLMGFLVAYWLLLKLQRDGMLRLPRAKVPDLVLNCCIFGVLVGGRLGYCIFYKPSLFRFSGNFPYWGVLRVWEGGMSAHGGVVFTILVLAWFAWKNKKTGASLVNLGDAACMVVPVGLCFGRIANFINGELYGHVSYVPWAVKFPSEIYAPTNDTIDPSVQAKLPGLLDKLFGNLMSYDEKMSALTSRLVHHDPQTVRAVAEILQPRHPSQLYESLLEGVLLFIIVWLVGRFWRKDGMAGGAFLTFYPVMRIIGEQFRVGDTPLTIVGVQVSKGIIYSIPMMAAGMAYWIYWIWRDRHVPWLPEDSKPTGLEPAAKNGISGT
jgi:phosphatidylglycerol:prolipoprotein diacylglycerol transferase